MRPGPARGLRWLVASGAAALLLAGLAASPDESFAAPQRRIEKTRTRLVRHLTERRGLLHVATFDEPVPADFVSGRPFVFSGTVAGPGRFGLARKFDGRERTQIEIPVRWDKIGAAFTLSFWANVAPGRSNQCIWYRAAEGAQVGFHLEDGRMTFDLPAAAGRQTVSYPFARYGTFVHLAATVDAGAGRMALYEDGRRMAEGPVQEMDMPRANMAFGKHTWYANRDPFRGWIDEATVWDHVLSDKAIRRLAHARRGVLWTAGGSVRYLKWRWAQTWARMVRAWTGWPDGLAALSWSGGQERTAIGRLPEVRLIVSGKVRRELVAAHRRSQQSGRRTQAGARRRSAHVAFAGQVHPAWICLAGGDMEYAEDARAGYVVELQDDARIFGARKLLLRPPEAGDWLYPLADASLRSRLGLRTVSNGLCRVSLQGWNLGTYLYSNHDLGGFLPGDDRASSTDGVRIQLHWNMMFHQQRTPDWKPAKALAAWPLSAREIQAIYDGIVDKWGGCLRGDLQNPLSRKEIDWRLAQGRERAAVLWPAAPETAARVRTIADFLDEFLVLGSNASPDRVVAPLALELPALAQGGVSIRWRSTAPAVLGADGAVFRPETGGPVAAQLVATVDDGLETAEKTLTFRVMPRRIPLAALFLNVRDALDKSRRVDAVAEICEPGEDFPSRVLAATQSARGGLEQRGNSSYWYAKKLFSLKTDDPHRLLDDSARRTLLAVNSTQDPTFVRNRAAYGLFRSWGTEQAPRLAPDSRHAEVFLNGRYYGLFELAARVDEDLLGGDPAAELDPESPRWIVYRHEAIRPRLLPMRARRPGDQSGNFLGPYLDLDEFLARPIDADWVQELGRRLDLANLADFQLLLNLFQNRNGYPFHYQLHDALVFDAARGTFFIVPWDFEMTPRALQPWEWLFSELMGRLELEVPGYAQRLSARWRELRTQGGLTPEALAARVDEAAAPLRGYVEWDYRRWEYGPEKGWEAALADLKDNLRESVVRMDARLGKPAAAPAPAPQNALAP